MDTCWIRFSGSTEIDRGTVEFFFTRRVALFDCCARGSFCLISLGAGCTETYLPGVMSTSGSHQDDIRQDFLSWPSLAELRMNQVFTTQVPP